MVDARGGQPAVDEPEPPQPLDQFRPEPLGLRLALEPDHDVVGEPHDDDIAMRPLPAPCPELPPCGVYGVGTPETVTFAAGYPARTCPCQRFVTALTGSSA